MGYLTLEKFSPSFVDPMLGRSLNYNCCTWCLQFYFENIPKTETVAALTFMVWDILLTFDDEVNTVWV
jgi:Family of unknown function (DUF6533)